MMYAAHAIVGCLLAASIVGCLLAAIADSTKSNDLMTGLLHACTNVHSNDCAGAGVGAVMLRGQIPQVALLILMHRLGLYNVLGGLPPPPLRGGLPPPPSSQRP
jgi:hypothetical protein